MIPCKCGCGETIKGIDARGRTRQYKNGHFWRGRKHNESSKEKMSLVRVGRFAGDKHPNWKGGKGIMSIGYIRVTTGPYTREFEHRVIMEQYLGRKLEEWERRVQKKLHK